ncbi:MAG: hypothetical protein ABIK96_11245 [bacterium]
MSHPVPDSSQWRTFTDHPFHELALSDREKFHTGFLKLAIERLGTMGFARQVFPGLPDGVLTVRLEKDSIDLLIEVRDHDGGPVTGAGIVEVKFKTGLHGDQIKRYKIKLSKQAAYCQADIHCYLVSLFPPIPGRDTSRARVLNFARDVAPALASALDRASGLEPDDRALFAIWLGFLQSLEPVLDHFDSTALGALPEYPRMLDRARLRGIFERQRLLAVRDQVGALPAGLQSRIANTHGNALIEFFGTEGIFSYGLQWQGGILKLFIAIKHASKVALYDEARRVALKALRSVILERCPYLRLVPDNPINKSGKFRSITLAGWDIWSDCRERPPDIRTILAALARDDCREIIRETHTAAMVTV